jgi:O-antigen/teichoic acid export membrane protein
MLNKRIAKNTMLLYFRMLITIGVSLYTYRIVLNALGIVDYGIYNVVGGVVILFSFLSGSMSSATQRFISVELAKKDYGQLKKIFSMTLNIHATFAIVIFILAETIGLWVLNFKLVIPIERIDAANLVYQFSILSFMLTIMSVPYNAFIIAHERMAIYAYVGFVDVIFKLIIAFVIVWFGFDKLKMYAILVFLVSVVIWFIYKSYCNINFPESKYIFFWDKSLYKTLMNYAGWNLFGNIATVTMGQGVNILLNIFFGPVVNSARGIAYQVNAVVSGFVNNFQMAINPQIYKSYAIDDNRYLHQLIFQGSKYSFYLLFFITLPILIETEIVLRWWLKIIPDNTILFCRLVLVNLLIDSISGPLMSVVQATGKIKKYQIVVGGLLLLILPISYIFLKNGFPPEITIYVSIFISIIALYFRLKIVSTLIDFSMVKFSRNVLAPVLLVSIVSLIFPLIIKYSVDYEFARVLLILLASILSVTVSIYWIGLDTTERQYIKDHRHNLSMRNLYRKI